MTRRDFLYSSSATAGAALLSRTPAYAAHADTKPIDAKAFDASRKFAKLPISNVAYVERGRGVAALFVHGYPLNGFQWRGALERLQAHRRCIAPDAMGLGHTETPEGQPISPATQAEMLAMLLDSLHIDSVDLVANDSGGLVSQVFVAKYPHRVRTLLLTNCDVDQNSPPPLFLPLIDLAKKGTLVDRFIVSQLNDKQLARSPKGLGGAYTYPDRLSDETIETYFRPIVETPLKKAQMQEYTISLGSILWSRSAKTCVNGRDRRESFGVSRTRSSRWSQRSGSTRRCPARAAYESSKKQICSFPKRCPTSSQKKPWRCGVSRRCIQSSRRLPRSLEKFVMDS